MSDISKEGLELWEKVKRTVTPLGEVPLQNQQKMMLDVDKTLYHKKKMASTYQAVIDLHGMTQDQAYSMLLIKIPQYKSMDYKRVLVITGKGNGNATGVLKRVFNGWMKNGPFAELVRDVSASKIEHGGDGAYYVTLS